MPPGDASGTPLSLASPERAKRASLLERTVAVMAHLTIHELAQQEGVSPEAVFVWLSQGLPSLLGPANLILIDDADAEAWLEEQDED